MNGSYTQIEDVLVNLIDNAINYMPEQSTKTIACSLTQSVKEITITVNDNGRGINKQDQDMILNRFYRSALNKDIPGTGLGLSICKEIVELHGGTISLTSQPGNTSFTINLPKTA